MLLTLLLLAGCTKDVDPTDSADTATPAEDCTDGSDNDGDALVDCADPDCAASCIEECDGSDGDQDGLIDCEDPDCYGSACAEICDDGVDNDGDGLLDCEDADCLAECTEQDCTDGLDNDGDGNTDCADDDCVAEPTCVPNKEVFITSAQIFRARQGRYWSDGYAASQWTSEATLTDVQGRIRFAPDPTLRASTASSVTSCSFEIDTWEMTGQADYPGFGNLSIVLDAPPQIQGLRLESPCSSFSSADFLPIDTLRVPGSSSQILWGALGTQLLSRSDSSWGHRDWLSGSEQQSFTRTEFRDLGYFSSNWTSVHSGSVHGVESFIWKAPL